MKIFWSWQSDTPGKTGRHFIRQALADAVAALKQPEDVEEPRERESKDALHIDQDRQGVPGSPDLARVILEKIDASRVFVADVTPVSIIPARKNETEHVHEKRNMNPNVAIELGYALRALTDRNVLMVLNTYYGGRQFLPFDLAHKAGPILFELAPDADKAAREAAVASLRGQFIVALRPYLLEQGGALAASSFQPTPSTLSPAAYFNAGETLAAFGEQEDGDRVEYGYPDGRGFYLRVMPRTQLAQPLPRSKLLQDMQRVGLSALWRNPGGLYETNSYGAIVVEPDSPTGGLLRASTQLFQNGEIWGVAPWMLVDNQYGKTVPCRAFEETFRARLGAYVQFLQSALNIAPPYSIEAGAIGLKGFRIVVGNGPDDGYPIYDDTFQVQLVVSDASQATLDRVALSIFEGLFRTSGYPRPPRLFGFPPA